MTDSGLLESIRSVLREELTGFARKDDLKGFATKDDLMSMERRLDAKFATKDDLMSMETRLNSKLNSMRNSNTQHHLRTREEVGHLNKKLGDMQEGLKQAAGLA